MTTPGGENVKLGGVIVALHELEIVTPLLPAIQRQWEAATEAAIQEYARRQDAADAAFRIASGHDALTTLPKPIATTKTDADGRYQFARVPRKPYALQACARRAVSPRGGQETEYYCWFVAVASAPEEPLAVAMLTTENMVGRKGAPESLLRRETTPTPSSLTETPAAER